MATWVLLAISFGHFAVDVVSGAIPVLLPHWQALYGLSYTTTGLLLLAATLGSAALQPVVGAVGDRVRTTWLLLGGLALSTVALAAALLAPSLWVVVVAVLLQGIGAAVYHPEASKMTYLFGGERRGVAMSIFQVGGNAGFGVSPVLTTLLLGAGVLATAAGYGLLGAVALGVLLYSYGRIRRRESAHRHAVRTEAKARDGDLWGPLLLLLGAVVLRTWVHTGTNAFVPLYFVTHLGRSAAFSGALLSTYLLSGAAGSIVGGALADRLGRKPVIVTSLAVPPLLFYLLPRTPDALLFPLVAVAGFFLTSSFPVTIVFGQELLPSRLGTATGLMLGAAVGTGGFGVTLLGMVADRWGAPAVWPVMAVLPLLALALVALVPRPAAGHSEAVQGAAGR
ncbi:MFS transporter [Limnochorda pilosa]|uniref:MFS transporter n=1 Tax=Limnochorda pilosa TaxID=1555112 RepID=UPI00130D7607|nr:MFS transporter [Limnochorda pilosa]